MTTTPLEHFFARVGVDPMTAAFPDIPARGHGGGGMMGGAAGERPAWNGGSFAQWAPGAFASGDAAPFSLYLHIPFCAHRCSFCPFYINPGRAGFSSEYSAWLAREIADTARVLSPSFGARKVQTVFFGGGTPSDLDRGDLAQLLRQLRDQFPLTADTEVTVEGRIRGFTADKARAWVDAGANRFSLGVQSTDTALRRKLGRLADRDEIRAVLQGLCASGAVVIIDLIYGFPEQTPEMLEEDIRFVAEETGVAGLDLYELKQIPHSPLVKAIEAGRIPPAPNRAERGRLYQAAALRLADYGFEHFTRKHWRRTRRERSLYNRTAFSRSDLLPFGSGAGGRIGTYGLSMQRELAQYTAMLERGEKPVALVTPGPPRPPGPDFREILAAHVEDCRLPAPGGFPEHCRDAAQVLLEQWTTAGLLRAQHTVGEPCHMTLAGTFWAEHLQRMLTALASREASNAGKGN